MMVYQEKIEPPPALTPDQKQINLVAQRSLANDDRWVKNLIDALAGIVRETKK